MPRKLVAALRAEGQEVESVQTLRLQGLENGKLYDSHETVFQWAAGRNRGETGDWVGRAV